MKGDTIINQVDEKAPFTGRLEESYANVDILPRINSVGFLMPISR